MKNKTLAYLIIILLVTSSVTGFLLMSKQPKMLSDEYQHKVVIQKLVQGKYLKNVVTPIPGYHFMVSIMIKVFNQNNVIFMRFISVILGLVSALVVFNISNILNQKKPHIMTLQFYFFPLIFPFFFLIFTEALSLLLILTTFYFLLQKNYTISGIVGIMATSVRQNNIIWLGFFCLYILHEEYPKWIYKRRKKYRLNYRLIKNYFLDVWTFILGFFLFTIFVIVNKGVTMADKAKHPIALHLGNIYLFLFLFFILFLPLNISNFKKIINLIKKNKYIIPLILIFFIVSLIFFVNNHPYNQIDRVWWIRNRLLNYITTILWVRILYFVTISYAALSLIVTELKHKTHYLIYPISFLFLGLSWLIDPRFLILPFAFFILFKKEKSKFIEYGTLLITIAATIYIFYGMQTGKFFL